MSYSSEQTRKRILVCAKKEFLKYGFQGANLRRIASEAKATTGALYNHFKNKEELFDEIVKGPTSDLLLKFQVLHDQACRAEGHTQAMEQSNSGTDWMLDYIYEHFDIFKLVFCCSEGSTYANYMEKLITIEESAYKAVLSCESNPVDEFFIHIMCSSGFRELYEVVAHDLSKEKAVQFMERVKRFRFAGLLDILGR